MAARMFFMASEELKEKIKEFEGCRLRAYQDTRGVWTIGVGHTKGVRAGMRISKARAEEYLTEDLGVAVRYVNGLGVCKTQGQFDALVDFAFNLGVRSLARSTLLYKIRIGAPVSEIQGEFRRWVYSGRKRLPGLVRRREWEAHRWAE